MWWHAEVGPLGGVSSWGWTPTNGMSAFMREAPEGFPPLPPREDSGRRNIRMPINTMPARYSPWSWTPSFQNYEKLDLCLFVPVCCTFVTTDWTQTRTLSRIPYCVSLSWSLHSVMVPQVLSFMMFSKSTALLSCGMSLGLGSCRIFAYN